MFEVGARVVVTGGDYAGTEGKVIAEGKDTAFVCLPMPDGEVVTVEVSYEWLRRAEEPRRPDGS